MSCIFLLNNCDEHNVSVKNKLYKKIKIVYILHIIKVTVFPRFV